VTFQQPVDDARPGLADQSAVYYMLPPQVPSPAPAPARRWAPGVTVGLVMLALVGASIATGSQARSATSVEQWLPADGHRVLFAQTGIEDGKYAEWSRPDMYSLVQSDLLAFSYWSGKASAQQSTQFLRLHAIQADATGTSTGLSDRLWTVESDGLRTAVDVDIKDDNAGGALAVLVMVPGRLDLPSGVSSGDHWTSTGSVWTWNTAAVSFDESTYTASFDAAPASEGAGCLIISMEQTIGDLTSTESNTWCPGLGITGFDGSTGAWLPSASIPPAAVETDEAFDWASADSLEFRPWAINEIGTVIVNPVSPPGLLQDGVIFAGKLQPDVLAVSTDGNAPKVVWAARPGGTLTASATLDSITFVASTNRQLVAYNNEGRWLWQSQLSDVSVVPPVLFDGLLVVVTLDGSVLALDPSTGVPTWTANLGAEIRSLPVTADGRLLVADQAGVLTSLDGNGRTQWAKDVGVPVSMAVSPGTDPVVVFAEANSSVLTAYSLADGSPVWRTRVFQTPRQLFALNTVLVMRDDYTIRGIEWSSGTIVWQWDRQMTATGIGGGDRLLLLTDTDLVLLADDGSEVRSWPHQLGHVTGTTTYLVATTGSVLVYCEDTAAIGGVTP